MSEVQVSTPRTEFRTGVSKRLPCDRSNMLVLRDTAKVEGVRLHWA